MQAALYSFRQLAATSEEHRHLSHIQKMAQSNGHSLHDGQMLPFEAHLQALLRQSGGLQEEGNGNDPAAAAAYTELERELASSSSSAPAPLTNEDILELLRTEWAGLGVAVAASRAGPPAPSQEQTKPSTLDWLAS